MKIGSIDLSRFGVLTQVAPPDGGGGAGESANPAGGGAATPPAEPSVIDVDENALIRVKGSDKPVKFGDHVRGFQSQFTKASQEAARLKRELQERETRLQRYEQERQIASQRGQGGQGDDVFAALKALPYLSGEDAVQVVQAIGKQIQQRDQITLALAKELQKVRSVVGTLHETHSGAAFESKINNFLNQGGFGDKYREFAKKLYLAYEPDETLDAEFPQILASEIENMKRLFEAEKAEALNRSRRTPFVPGRGGQASPTRPVELDPKASAKEIAEQLWGQWNESGT
jgi:hypothetical protein